MEQNYSMKRDIVLLFFSLLVIFCAESSNVHVCRHMEPYMDISQICISGEPKISSEYAYAEKHAKLDSLEQILCNKPQIQESVYMHIDNTGYFLGDTLWYKAYVMRSDNFKPTNISRILYVELLTSEGYLVERQQLALDENSTAYGQFVIRDSLYSGYYELRAYTKWMLNFNVTEKNTIFSTIIIFTTSNVKKIILDCLMGYIHVSFPYMKRIRIQKTMKINGCNSVQSNEFIQTEQN